MKSPVGDVCARGERCIALRTDREALGLAAPQIEDV
jgi:hypothetical protein